MTVHTGPDHQPTTADLDPADDAWDLPALPGQQAALEALQWHWERSTTSALRRSMVVPPPRRQRRPGNRHHPRRPPRPHHQRLHRPPHAPPATT
jgi:hypothetical protein